LSRSVENLEKRIAVLERKINREKFARNLAENQLEKYSQEIYETNRSLQRSLASSKKKQAELEYLANASSEVVSDISLKELMTSTVSLTGQFFFAECGFYLVTKDGSFENNNQGKVWFGGNEWRQDLDLMENISHLLPLEQQEQFDSWLVSPLSETTTSFLGDYKWLVYVNFTMLNNKIGWIVFLSSAEYLDEEALYVLEMARGHLLSGIGRRLSDVKMLKRTIELEESVNHLKHAKKQLIHSEKVASLGQLAAGVAHEINNPIAFVRSNMEVLNQYIIDYKSLHSAIKQKIVKDEFLDLASFEALCESIELNYINADSIELLDSNIEGLERVKDIVENLKSFSHAGVEEYKQVSLFDCIDSGLKIAWNVLKYEHRIDNNIQPSCPTIIGSKGQLQQVFVNLFVNAAHAMEKGGTLSISQSATAETIVIHVKDDGMGMDEETLNQLFIPFFTTKPVGVGTGLGMSVSYAILEAHGVNVTIDSAVGIGTTFHLSFPIVKN
jgi:two-component system NtrC family sensor kinase